MSDTIKAQLQKILALAESGVGGERENARALLERMMARHGITMADLDDQAKTWVEFFCSKGEARDLLIQIVAMTFDEMRRVLALIKAHPPVQVRKALA